jgi:ATP-binding cassette subfamily B protein IrtB
MINYLMKKYALSNQGAKDFIKATISCTITNLVLMLPVSLLYLLVDDLLKGVIPKSHYYIYGLGIIAILLLIFISNYFQYNATYFLTYKESGIRRISLAEKLRKLPLSFFGKKDLSELTNVILGDAKAIEQSFSHFMPEFFGSIISTCFVAISLFFFDWRMAIASLWVLPIALLIVGISGKVQNFFNRNKDKAELECFDGIQECIETVRDLKSNNATEKYLEGLNKKIRKIEKKHIASELGVAIFVVSATLLLKFGIATTTLVGSYLLINNSLTVITFFMYLLVVSRIYEPMGTSLQHLAAIINTKINIDRMNEINEYPVQKGTQKLKANGYDIEFKNVGFSYNENEPVLKDISFIAKQGEVTALIGPSGGGKTTASKLCARFWDADKGKITLGGTNISSIDPETLLSAYSIVFQDVTLFNNTVMENIRIGKKGATDEEVLRVAKEARCDEFIKKLPNGYNTIIGENGANLSGGERQRISIARALLKNAPVILLDEATASLDAENETEVQEAISKLVKDKTVLIIAHRMRTVTNANKIVVLKDGFVAEQGEPDKLLKQNSIFADMVQKQTESSDWKLI